VRLIDNGIIQIVRRFGAVGGMESYAYNLSEELARRGHKVSVLCENVETDSIAANVSVIPLGPSHSKHRWRAMLDFRTAVDQFFESYSSETRRLVHSHERTAWHQVTTFHGPPMKNPSKWYQFRSRRIKVWDQLEEAEVLGRRVASVVPVSSRIAAMLAQKYPRLEEKLVTIAPGTNRGDSQLFQPCQFPLHILFAGKEWKRKGLSKAVDIVAHLRREGFDVTLDIYGVARDVLPKKWGRSDFLSIKGWVAEVPYGSYDLLLHPAKEEPFGMVIAESLANGCRALVSTNCGALDLQHQGCLALNIEEADEVWANELLKLCACVPAQQPPRTWANVSSDYEMLVYSCL